MRKMQDLHAQRNLQSLRLNHDKSAPVAVLARGQMGRVEKKGKDENGKQNRIKTFK